MAEHNEVAYTTADGNDYPAHEQTYEGFITLVKYGIGGRHLHRRHDGDFPDLTPRRRAAGRRRLEKLPALGSQNQYPSLRI